MEIFNVKRRDVFDFDSYMDLKKPGFGGPSSALAYKDGRGGLVNSKPKLKEYQRQVERHPQFGHPVYDPTYKAMTHDLVYKQSKKKPFTYRDPYLTGVPVVDMSKVEERFATTSFNSFLNEEDGFSKKNEVELVIRLDQYGLIHSHKITLLQRLSKYPGSLVDLVGSEEELQMAVDIYTVPCQEILNSEGRITRLRCRADDLLVGMEKYQESTRDFHNDRFSQSEEF